MAHLLLTVYCQKVLVAVEFHTSLSMFSLETIIVDDWCVHNQCSSNPLHQSYDFTKPS